MTSTSEPVAGGRAGLALGPTLWLGVGSSPVPLSDPTRPDHHRDATGVPRLRGRLRSGAARHADRAGCGRTRQRTRRGRRHRRVTLSRAKDGNLLTTLSSQEGVGRFVHLYVAEWLVDGRLDKLKALKVPSRG